MATLGNRLKELRNEKDQTQTDLAKAIGVSQSTYALYETDNRQPDYEKVKFLADYFNVSTDYLLGRTDERRESPFVTVAAHTDGDDLRNLSPEERDELLDYLELIRKRRAKGK